MIHINFNTKAFKLTMFSLVSMLSLHSFSQSNPTSSAQGFNIFVKNGCTLQSSQVQGPVAMGGDFSLNNSNFTVAASTAGSFQVSGLSIGLLIGGKVNYSSGNTVYVNNGYMKIGNSTGTTVWYKDNNGASSNLRVTSGGYGNQPYIQLQNNASNLGVSATTNPVLQSGLIDFGAAFTQFQTSSTCMASYTGNASLTNPNGNSIPTTNLPSQVKINLASGVNVLNISGTDLNNVSNFTYNSSPDASHILVINVNAAGSYSWNVWNQSGVGTSNCPYIIYNFYNTTTLTISGNNTIEGTVFAPYADITKSSSANIEGQIIGNSYFQSGGSINSANFNYSLPACCTKPVVAAIAGATSVCNATTTTLTDATSGGLWSSSTTSIATINTTGTVSAVAAGTTTISYAVTNSCGTTTVTSSVTVKSPSTSTTNASICSGSSYTFNGTAYSAAGTYVVHLTNSVGCDSAATLVVTVKAKSTSTTNASICSGSSYTFNGTAYTAAGTYVAHLTNSVGCDSAATLLLTVNPMVTPSISVASSTTSICNGGNVTFTATVSNIGANSFTYQWKKNNIAIAGATGSTYSSTTMTSSDSVSCTITVSATCIANNTLTSNSIGVILLAPGTWVGGTSSSWSTPSNWCGAAVPSNSIDVTVPVGVNNYPTITGIYPARNLVIQTGATLTVTGTLQLTGAITNNGGVLDVSGGTIELNGTTAQTIPAGALKNKLVQNITINNAAGVSLGDTLKVTGTVTPNAGTLTTGGLLVLKSSSAGTARIATGNGNYIAGNVTVERYIDTKTVRKYSFVGSTTSQTIRSSWQSQIYITGAGTGGTPCGAGTGNGGATDRYNSNGFDETITNYPSMYTYNATPVNGSRWVSVPSTSINMVPGKGYKVNIRGNRNSTTASCNNQLNTATPIAPEAVVLSATGAITTGNVTVAVNDPAVYKYTLLGNPYPSQISFSAFQSSNSSTISNKMWAYSPYGNGNYTTYSAGIIANAATGYDNNSGNYLASGQAFFVESISSGSVTFSESHKTSGAIPNSQYFGLSHAKLVRIGLQTDSSAALDEVVVRFNPEGAKSYVADWDAVSFGGGAQSLVTIKGSNHLAIATYLDDSNADTIQLGISSSTVGAFRFSFSDMAGIDSNRAIILHDKYLATYTDVRANPIYNFNVTSDTSSKGNYRFELLINAASSTLPVNFTSIKASKKTEGAEVTWTVAQEVNVKGYIVERSTDGVGFSTVATVKVTDAGTYSINDNNLPTANTIYYRVKSIEMSGTANYSKVAKLTTYDLPLTTLSIYPNPVQDKLNITVNAATNNSYSVKVTTVTGQQVFNKSNATLAGNKISIDASNLTSGVYLVELTNTTGTKITGKFIKE